METQTPNIAHLKRYHKNPRKITDKSHKLLEKTMLEFGDLSGIVLNKRTGELIGGNQRVSILQKYPSEAIIEVVGENPQADAEGSLAFGFVSFRGSKFAYREVDWDEDKEARANIIANKVGGFFDNDVLANEFDENMLLESGFEDFELGMFAEADIAGEKDENTLSETLDTYLDGSIKQFVLYYKKEEYDAKIELVETLAKLIQEEEGLAELPSNTDVFDRALTFYANSKGL